VTGFVVDASALGPLIVPDEAADAIPGLLGMLAEQGALAPQHWRLEIANLMRMSVRRKRLKEDEIPGLVTMLSDLAIEVDYATVDQAWGQTLALATLHDLTAYDAAYLELAMRRGCTLVTNDKALQRAAQREGVETLC
jgi:predicted nucleic acid-binding protein